MEYDLDKLQMQHDLSRVHMREGLYAMFEWLQQYDWFGPPVLAVGVWLFYRLIRDLLFVKLAMPEWQEIRRGVTSMAFLVSGVLLTGTLFL